VSRISDILKAPKSLPEDRNFLQKKDFGKVPDYLNKINEELSKQYRIHQELQLNEEKEKDQKL
jgi:hypothetical protein